MALFGLSKTKEALFGGISKLFGGKSSVIPKRSMPSKKL
jgi:hypothetical protein